MLTAPKIPGFASFLPTAGKPDPDLTPELSSWLKQGKPQLPSPSGRNLRWFLLQLVLGGAGRCGAEGRRGRNEKIPFGLKTPLPSTLLSRPLTPHPGSSLETQTLWIAPLFLPLAAEAPSAWISLPARSGIDNAASRERGSVWNSFPGTCRRPGCSVDVSERGSERFSLSLFACRLS